MNLVITALIIVAALIVLDASNRWKRNRMSARRPNADDATDADVEALVRDGRKLTAIKLYREIHKVDLTTARMAVDRLAENVRSASPVEGDRR